MKTTWLGFEILCFFPTSHHHCCCFYICPQIWRWRGTNSLIVWNTESLTMLYFSQWGCRVILWFYSCFCCPQSPKKGSRFFMETLWCDFKKVDVGFSLFQHGSFCIWDVMIWLCIERVDVTKDTQLIYQPLIPEYRLLLLTSCSLEHMFQEEVLNRSPSFALQFPWREVILYATLAYHTSQLGQHCMLHMHTQTPTA